MGNREKGGMTERMTDFLQKKSEWSAVRQMRRRRARAPTKRSLFCGALLAGGKRPVPTEARAETKEE